MHTLITAVVFEDLVVGLLFFYAWKPKNKTVDKSFGFCSEELTAILYLTDRIVITLFEQAV